MTCNSSLLEITDQEQAPALTDHDAIFIKLNVGTEKRQPILI